MPPNPPFPPHVAALLTQAGALLRAGRPAEAVAPMREAARWMPGHAGILHDLGLACLEGGLVAEAVGALRGAVAADPRFAEAHLRLGIALEMAGSFEAALAAYAAAVAVRPGLADARYRAGELLDSLGRTGEAAAQYRGAARAAAKTILGRMALAKALLAENQDREAEKTLRQALALDRGNAAALELLGNVLADAGRFEEARAVLLQAIEAAPLRAGAYYEVVRCAKVAAGDEGLIARMRAAAAMPGLDAVQRARVHLALGKASDDLGRYEEAMRHFDAAEALRNSVLRFDPAAYAARAARMIARFTPAVLARNSGCDDATPILIMGLPRSGTTLVEQIISAHPDVRGGGELPFWTARGGAWDAAGGEVPEAAGLEALAADYLRMLRGIGPGVARVTDKMPLNVPWAGLIHMALPRATILYCRRGALDTALSIHQTHFNPRMGFPTGGAALVAYMRTTGMLAAHWRAVLPAERFVEVEYETLVRAPETEIRRIVAACGLGWNAACLRPETNARAVRTASKWQARQAIHRGAIGRWRAYEPWIGALGALREDASAASKYEGERERSEY